MLRFPLHKALSLPNLRAAPKVVRCLSGAAPEKIEVFIDDKKVMVDPGTTVLQVSLLNPYTYRFFPKLHWK